MTYLGSYNKWQRWGLTQGGLTLNPVLLPASFPGSGHIFSSLDYANHLPVGLRLLAGLIWPLHSCQDYLPRTQVCSCCFLPKKTSTGSWLSKIWPG